MDDETVQIAVRGVDQMLWRLFRAEAIQRRKTAGQLLNDVLSERAKTIDAYPYLERPDG